MPVLCVPKMFKVSPSKHSNFKTVRISGIWNFLDLSEVLNCNTKVHEKDWQLFCLLTAYTEILK